MMSIKRVSLIAMIIMAIVSFSNLFGLNIAGMSVIIGILFFFINKAFEKKSSIDSGVYIKAIGTSFKYRRIWILIVLPLIMDAFCIVISKLFLPEYIEHVLARTETFVSFDKLAILIIQLAVLALGEEIAWRAFFQKQLCRALPVVPVLLISSLLFSLGHLVKGNIIVVSYDVFFVFINSILYGIIFYESKNAWISAISHFCAILFSVIVLVLI